MFVSPASTQSRLLSGYRGSGDNSVDFQNRYGSGFSSRSPSYEGGFSAGSTLPRRSAVTSSIVRPLPVGPTSVNNGQYESSTSSSMPTVRTIPIRYASDTVTSTLGRRTVGSASSKPPLPFSAYERISSSLGNKYSSLHSPDLRHHNLSTNRYTRSSSTDRSPAPLYQRHATNDDQSYRLANSTTPLIEKFERLSDQSALRPSSAAGNFRRLSTTGNDNYLSARSPSPLLATQRNYSASAGTRNYRGREHEDEEERDVLPSLLSAPSASNGVGTNGGNFDGSMSHAGLYRSRVGAVSVPDVPTYAKSYISDTTSIPDQNAVPAVNGYNRGSRWNGSNRNSLELQELEDDDEENGVEKEARGEANYRRSSTGERNNAPSTAVANGASYSFVKNEPSRSSTSSVDSSESSRLSSGRNSNASDGGNNSRYGESGRYIRNEDSDGRKFGSVGLRNLGNTCFMNSVIQCLSNTKPLRDYLLQSSSTFSTDINNNTTSRMKGALVKAFREVLSDLWTTPKGGQVSPDRFKTQIQKFAPRFTGYSQQDAQEFLRYLLQGLHEDINRVQNRPPALPPLDDSLPDGQKAAESWKRYLRLDDSKVVDIFVGQLKSELRCTSCGHVSITFDPFWDLSLPIPQDSRRSQVSLSDCLDSFTKEEVLDGDEKPTCESCKTRRRCTKKFSIQKYPSILVLHLKRFSGERYRSRLSTLVDFPLTQLDLTPYSSMKSGVAPTYDLYAISNHCGTPLTGHYTAYCKNAPNARWYLFDDTRVTPANDRSIVSSEAYVLFYELATNSSSRL